MDIRINPSKIGNRYVLGRTERDIRNVTGSFHIDEFASGIISKYEKTEGTELPNAELELLKRPDLPEALADIQEIINELLIINRSSTDIKNTLFRNISIENNILRCEMLFSKLESNSQYKEIRQGLENIYRIQLSRPAEEESKEEKSPELSGEIITEENLVNQIETVLRDGGIKSNELVERIMSTREHTESTERRELIHQPEYIPMNTVPLSRWKSLEAKSFFWRVQRLEKQDRELVLKSLGNISLSKLERVLSEMDSPTWYKYSVSIAENIRVGMEELKSGGAENVALMAEPMPAEHFYRQLLEILGDEESLTPELLLEEKENLIRFLEKEDSDTERIRTEIISILNNIHRESFYTPTNPQKIVRLTDDEDAYWREDLPGQTDGAPTGTEEKERAVGAEESEEAVLRKKVIDRVLKDVTEMTVEDFSSLYDAIWRDAAQMPKDIVDQLLPTLRVAGQEVTEQDVEVDRQSVINFLRKNQIQQVYYQEMLLKHILRADERRIKNYQSASELAETTMNLSVSEWKQFTEELRQLSEKSELSRRYLQASKEAAEAADKAGDGESPISGVNGTRQLTPEMKEQVESTKEKMIFITQLDRAFKEGVDMYEEGDILSENSIFSNYVYRQEDRGENTLFNTVLGPDTRESVMTESERRSLVSELKKNIREGVETRLEQEFITEDGAVQQYVHRRGAGADGSQAPVNRSTGTRALVQFLTRDNLRMLSETVNRIIREREERAILARKELLLEHKDETKVTSQLEAIIEKTELIHPDLRVKRIRSSMEPMLEALRSEGPTQAAVDQAINYIEKRRDARTGEIAVREELTNETPVELVTMRRPEQASREEIEEIKKNAEETKRQLDENRVDIQFIKGDSEHTEVTNEKVVDMKALKEKLTVQENEIEKIKEIQERLIRGEKSDSYYTKKTITKVNEQLRMEKMRRGL